MIHDKKLTLVFIVRLFGGHCSLCWSSLYKANGEILSGLRAGTSCTSHEHRLSLRVPNCEASHVCFTCLAF